MRDGVMGDIDMAEALEMKKGLQPSMLEAAYVLTQH
jgi:hypothetical protein